MSFANRNVVVTGGTGALGTAVVAAEETHHVEDVRVLGAIGVVEMKQPVDMKTITQAFIDAGVWIRPFGKLVYLMPPFVINDDDLEKLINTVVNVAEKHGI